MRTMSLLVLREVGVSGMIALVAGMCAALMSWGYLVWLGTRKPVVGKRRAGPSPEPAVDVIVATYNEAARIEDKVANLRGLRYPRERLRFWIVDGASSDGTADIAVRCVRDDPRFTILREHPDKTAQVNAALARCAAPWIFVTDADARLHPATLTTLLEVAAADESVGAVGVAVCPAESCHWLERVHWRISNRVRQLEGLAGCASLVTAPGYLVRRELVARLPADVEADDVHVALTAGLSGCRVGFADTPVVELRAPRTLPELFGHKLRKTRGYLREIFRFLPALPRMPETARAVFAWRALQLIVLPWTAALAAGALLLTAAGAPAAALAAAGMGVAAALLVGAGAGAGGARAALGALALALFLVPVCMAALVVYPFARRTACFPRVGAGRREEARR